MKAKLVRKVPGRLYGSYEFECIDCGRIYTRSKCSGRISPYCGYCSKKHEREKIEERKSKRDREMINDVLDKIMSEINEIDSMTFLGNGSGCASEMRSECLGVIRKYRTEEE